MTSTAVEPTVFLIEDDPAVRGSLALLMELAELRVEPFSSAADFEKEYSADRPGCLVLDVHLPGMSGTELHERLIERGVLLPTIFLTGHAPPRLSEESRRRGVVAVFEKPCRPEELIRAVNEALAVAGQRL